VVKASDWAAGAVMLFAGMLLFVWLGRWVEVVGMFLAGCTFLGISYMMSRKR
jgi:ascorbate-specific PTS system EIIC-type component UlaA